MKNKKGFTLIEMLSVIVIIGLLMTIAIQAVSKYIDQSRRKSYVASAKEYITVAAQEVAKGTFVVRNSDTSYYIHINNLNVEKGGKKSPYGNWVDAYVVVTIDDNNKYTYYWISQDDAGFRIDLTKEADIRESSIYVSKKYNIDINEKIDGRKKIVLYDKAGNRSTKNL